MKYIDDYVTQTTIIKLKLAEKKLDLIRQAAEQRYNNTIKNNEYMIPYQKMKELYYITLEI